MWRFIGDNVMFYNYLRLCDDSSVTDLRAQLHEKDMKLTDIRLEALSSAHQLEQLRENMMRMKVSNWCAIKEVNFFYWI